MFSAEATLLEALGHEVTRYAIHNNQVPSMTSIALARATVWNSAQYQRVRDFFLDFLPDVVHVHNTLPLISPAAYYAARAASAAVVQTLHNYRYSCVNGLFYRDGHICEDCIGKTIALPGVLHSCYRGSRAASGVVAAMLAYHKLRGTYHAQVDRYIALTEFSREKFIEMGLSADKLSVKPNFVDPDPGIGAGDGSYALFVGRLAEEKGVRVLLDAWRQIGVRFPLKVVGSGPLAHLLNQADTGVQYLGQLPRPEVLNLLKSAGFMIFPSLWYEGFPMTIAEAFASGTPVVASHLGNSAAIVENGRTGLHFEPGNPDDLAAKVEWLLDHPAELASMRVEARTEYEAKYTAEKNYHQLIGIYEDAIRASRS